MFDNLDRVFFNPLELRVNDIVIVEAIITRYVPRVPGKTGNASVAVTGTWKAAFGLKSILLLAQAPSRELMIDESEPIRL